MRQSIYWLTVFSMIEKESIQAAVLDACERCGVKTPVECDHEDSEGTGNVGSICGAIGLINPSNADDSDRENLGKCLALISFLSDGVKVVDESKKEPAKKEPSKKAPPTSKKKAVVAPVPVSVPPVEPHVESITVAESSVDLAKPDEHFLTPAE
jgi:hypothetical protein